LNSTTFGIDKRKCGKINVPCKTIEYAIKEISIVIEKDENAFIDIKNIGICVGGYELSSTIEINPNSTKSNNLLIMKENYGS
jgi:poly(3-hydroxyalkanoate) synthetase